MSEAKYFNFPVKLLEGIFKDKQEFFSDILNYSMYSHSLKLDGEEYIYTSAYYKFIASAKWYNITGTTEADFKRGKKLFDSIPANYPKAGLNISIFWDYYKNEKSDFDIACLAAFLAIKSILGDKPYCKTDNSFLWGRMNGNSKAIKDRSELNPVVLKYANEYQTKKIKNALRESWGLVTYSRYTRGFFVSFTLDLPVLVLEAEKRRKSTKQDEYKRHEKDVVKQVLQKLKSNNQ